ncbi:MAG TPA: sugar nucleotide-binding protein, partial [Magnetococcales bacterium]|nr:sugar nucleotide-binding protein [Magnetococcales bacterium]
MFITGVDGLTGGNLAWYFKDRVARVLGISRTHPVAIPDVETPALNVQNYNRVRQCLTQFKPEVIIHTISAVHYGHDPADQERSWRSNVLSTRVILDAARDLHARVVLISIEAEDSPFNEEVPIVGDPENWYVSDRTEAERMVMDHPESLVLRTRLFGWNVGDVECFPEWLLRNLFNKETVFCFTERVFSAIYVLDFAELLGRCLRQGVTGFFRVIGNDDLSNYSFGQELARIFGLDPAFIQPRIVRLPLPANAACLPTDGQPTLLNEIGGGQVPTVREGLAAFFRDWRDGFPNRLKECAKVAAPVCILPQRDVIPYGCQLIDADDMEAVTKVLHSWSLTQGPTIDHFEKDVAQTVHARYAVAVNSGT